MPFKSSSHNSVTYQENLIFGNRQELLLSVEVDKSGRKLKTLAVQKTVMPTKHLFRKHIRFRYIFGCPQPNIIIEKTYSY